MDESMRSFSWLLVGMIWLTFLILVAIFMRKRGSIVGLAGLFFIALGNSLLATKKLLGVETFSDNVAMEIQAVSMVIGFVLVGIYLAKSQPKQGDGGQ